MSTILFIDTAFTHTHVGLAQGNLILQSKVNSNANEQAATLNLMIEEILETQNMDIKNIDAIAVDAGPGSYTGLRVGLGVAKGLCFALSKPILLFNKLALLTLDKANVLLVIKARAGEGFAIAKRNGKVEMEAQHIFYDKFDWQNFQDFEIVSDDETILNQFENAQKLESHIIDLDAWNQLAQTRYQNSELDNLAYSEPYYLKSAFTTTSKKKLI